MKMEKLTAAQSEIRKALKLCRGEYQRSIILGVARLSGSDLKGTAKKYADFYARSRNNLLSRLRVNGIQLAEALEYPHRKRVLVFGEPRIFLANNGRKLQSSNPYLFNQLVKATETGRNYKRVRALAEIAIDNQTF
jgi:hypothetical protein